MSTILPVRSTAKHLTPKTTHGEGENLTYTVPDSPHGQLSIGREFDLGNRDRIRQLIGAGSGNGSAGWNTPELRNGSPELRPGRWVS